MDKEHQHQMHEHAAENDHTDHQNHQQTGHGEGHRGHGVDHSGHERIFRSRFWISLLLSIPVLIYSPAIQGWLGFTTPAFTGSSLIVPLISILIFVIGGIPFIQMAVPEIKQRSPGMMSLITLAIGVALLYSLAASFFNLGESFYWELVTLIDIMLLGHWIEMRSVRQASGSLNELARLLPDTAERIGLDGQIQTVQTQDLKVGDIFLVRPGSSIPADGGVIEGESHVNQAMITGESKPVFKAVGDSVIAGTINDEGSLRVLVTGAGENTALAGIMRLVMEAQTSKSRTQILADKAAGWLFYLALAVAAITGIAWLAAVGFDIEVIKRVTTVLVIACPHALGLAVPLVVAISTARGAQNGILVRDRIALEEARLMDVAVFDKTGTLTTGDIGVAAITVADGWNEDRALSTAAGLEENSEHLIARAIKNEAEARGINPLSVDGFTALKGRGVQGQVGGFDVYLGGPRLLETITLLPEGEMKSFADQAGAVGQSVVYLIVDGHLAAAFSLADRIRPESQAAVRQLQESGVEVVMLTGDSQDVARGVALELGIDRVYAEVLPEDKDRIISQIQQEGKKVAMVGDGVNDAPALTRADIGIAIGSGTDVAVESAGLILVQSNPLDIPRILRLSRRTYQKMSQNLIWATGYNLVAIPLAAGILAPWGILLSPAVGALLMSLSTIIVAINAQLLRRGEL